MGVGSNPYLQEKLAELDTEIGGVRHRELVFRYLSIGIAVPQVTLGAVMTATALLESLVPPESARTIVGYLGIANLAVQSDEHGRVGGHEMSLPRRLVELGYVRRAGSRRLPRRRSSVALRRPTG